MNQPFDANWLFAAVLLATPLIYAAAGELVSQRAGVINVGLEGMMLTGAFTAYVAVWQTGSIGVGVLSGMAGGMLLASLMGVLSVNGRADQIIVGVGLNLLALGLTTFLLKEVFPEGDAPLVARLGSIRIPVLADIPLIGRALFAQSLLVYGAFVAMALVWIMLGRTRFGLSLRATGEMPAAADTAGVNVNAVRWAGVLCAGGLAGVGGAFLSVGELGLFGENMTAGRGFLAFAAVIFGGWRALGVLSACLVFGGADALQLRLQAEVGLPRSVWVAAGVVVAFYVAWTMRSRRGTPRKGSHMLTATALLAACIVLAAVGPSWSAPSQLWLALPYLLTLAVLAGFVGRVRPPGAWAVPYDRLNT